MNFGAEVPEIPHGMEPVEPLIRAKGWGLWMYCAGLALFPVIAMGSMLLLIRTDWFMRHDNYEGMRTIGYGRRMEPLNCEVLIYGDSSTLTGLDPKIVQGITGLKTCNIAEGVVVQNVAGSDEPLQAYLAKNRPPRFLLTMWTSSDFRPYRPPQSGQNSEGFVYLAQFDGIGSLLHAFERRPSAVADVTAWAMLGMSEAVTARVTGNKKTFDALADRESRLGQFPLPLPTETHCVRRKLPPAAVKRWEDSVREFRQRFTNAETQVIVNISPVPDCDADFDQYARMSAGLHDNAFERVPIRYFNEGDVHFSAEGSHYISEEAGEQILRLMKKLGVESPKGEAR